jgi:hypothetical protein
MLFIEVLSNDEASSVTEDAAYSAGSAAAALSATETLSHTAPRAAGGSRVTKTVPRPYSPPPGVEQEGRQQQPPGAL